MIRMILTSLVVGSALVAGGYKVPETSMNAVALGAANIAHNKSADAAYYNPANMTFMSNENALEVDLMYIGLDAIKYTPKTGTSISAESESFIIPSFHYVSAKLYKVRLGLSIVSPGGLSKRWSKQPAKASSEEFTLQVIEVNPTVAFSLSDSVSAAYGFRIVQSSGIVKGTPAAGYVSLDMKGDSLGFGYNLALAYKPTSDLEIGLTYRSQVSLDEKGSANLKYTQFTPAPVTVIDGNYDVQVSVPLPATFVAAIAYTLPTKTTIELVYEKTYWSAYATLDFDYTSPLAEQIFGNPKAKNWKDTNTYRLGITQELASFTLMAGLVLDKSPVPESALNYELPDSDSTSVSFGCRYKINDKLDVGLAALYSIHETRVVSAAINESKIDGEFSNSNVFIASTSLGYKF